MCHWFCYQRKPIYIRQLGALEVSIPLSESPRDPGFVAIATAPAEVEVGLLSERQQLVGYRLAKYVGAATFQQNL